jgi:DNA-directed RNA polymerase specialized sigma subunit
MKDGALLKGSQIEGYRILRLRVKGKFVAFLFHRLVAEYYVRKSSVLQEFVIHLNYKKQDNRADNLRWATIQDVAEHNRRSPAVKAYRKKLSTAVPNLKRGLKLSLAQVKQIKKMLQSPLRKLTHKQIAAKYGISEMAVTRINRGENWGYVKV